MRSVLKLGLVLRASVALGLVGLMAAMSVTAAGAVPLSNCVNGGVVTLTNVALNGLAGNQQ